MQQVGALQTLCISNYQLYALSVPKRHASKAPPSFFHIFVKEEQILFLDKVWHKFEAMRGIMQNITDQSSLKKS